MQALRGNLYRTNSADCGGGIAIDDGDEDLALLLIRSSRFTGNTATFVANDGDPTSKLRVLAGLKVWF